MNRYPLFIHGSKPTNQWKEIKSPYNGKVIAEIEKADSAAVEQALSNTDRFFSEVMKSMPAYKRSDILNKVAVMIGENVEELALLIASEGGKPLKHARAEAIRAVNTVKMSADEALNLNGEQITMDRAKGSENHLAFTVRQPVGAVLAISAFNHPLNLFCHQVAPAIAAGNTVLVKPASQTPLSTLKIANYFKAAGLPDGVLNVLTISGSETDAVVQDERVKFVTFIGGADVGWEIRKKVKPGVKIVLEHGGTAQALVDKSADLSKVIPSIVKGGFYHAGQVCVSTQIVYAHEDIYENLKDGFVNAVSELVTGDPTFETTDVGPLIASGEVDRVEEWVNEAVSMGANILIGGRRLENNCYAPTILENVSYDMTVIKKEIFGPVVCLRKYSDINDVIASANKTPYSFQSAVYSQDIDIAMHYCKKIDTKACIVNDHTAFRVDWMPFAGAKESGLGIGGVKYSVKDMTEEKLIVIKTSTV